MENHMKCICFWSGIFSTVYPNGSLTNYILNFLNSFPDKKITFFMPQSDGDIMENELDNVYIDSDSILIIGTVAQRFYNYDLQYILLPQDDGIFENGLRYYLFSENLPKWEDRKSQIFWRGSGSRRSGFLRRDVVLKLSNNPNADVKFVNNWIYDGDGIPEECIGENVNYLDFAKYKMVLIVDGNGISSSHSWCFGIGCVPFMITNNDFWFKSFLIPFGNYIPIKYDLSDLEEKIEWVLEHDIEAKAISERATTFAYRIFTPEFQKEYINKRICEIIDSSHY
jgi:hypothetical protein